MERLDVVYMAPDLGSLFGAVALAAGGLKVLVLEGEAKRPQEKPAKDEARPGAPKEPFLLRGLRAGGFLEPLLNRLGLLNRAREKVERIDPSFQVVTPDARVEVCASKEDIMREFAREFGSASKGAAALFSGFEQLGGEVYRVMGGDNFPSLPKGIGGKLFRRATPDPEVEPLRTAPLSQLLADHALPEKFRMFLLAAIAGLGAPGGDGMAAAAAAAVIDSARRGLYRADETELTKMILSTFKTRGGYTFPLQELEAAEMTGREIGALRMPKSNYIKSRLFIGSFSQWAEYLPQEIKKTLLPPSSHNAHRLDITVNSEAIPVGMKDRVIFLPQHAKVIRPEHVTRISLSPAFDADGASMRIVSAQSIRPGGKDAREELRRHVLEIIPFLDEHSRNEQYTVETIPRILDTQRPFLEPPPNGAIDNLLPNEGEYLSDMGIGDGVISSRILARVILRKLGLRAEI